MKNPIFLSVLILLSLSVFAGGEEKKAEKFYLKEDYKNAFPLYADLNHKRPEDKEIQYRLSICCFFTHRYEEAAFLLEKLVEGDNSRSFPLSLYYLGAAYHKLHLFDKAISSYNKDKETLDPKTFSGKENLRIIEHLISSCNHGKNLLAHPLQVKIEHLAPGINTPFSEKNPVLSADGTTIYFSSSRHTTTGGKVDKRSGRYYEDIYYTVRKSDGTWEKVHHLPGKVNDHIHEAPLFISADGRKLLLYRADLNSSGDIFYSELKNSHWLLPVDFGEEINSPEWETGAFLNAEGSELYFSSEREGGYGGKDIYKSVLLPSGKWSKPINLGPGINTPFNEDNPFLLNDGKTLLFSSQGHTSIGGYDLFKAVADRHGKWINVTNLGYPVNTAGDEQKISVSADGSLAVFSSTRSCSYGDEDLYMISDANAVFSRDNLLSAVNNISENNILIPVYDSASASAFGNEAVLTVSSSYLNNTVPVSTVSFPDNKQTVADRMPVFSSTSTSSSAGDILKDKVHFPFNEYKSITEYSRNKLENVIAFLNQNPQIRIEIGGYSDNTGSKEYNEIISEKRARTVYEYLVKRGIDKSRMEIKRYGNSNLIVFSDSVSENVKNRRVEFKILREQEIAVK